MEESTPMASVPNSGTLICARDTVDDPAAEIEDFVNPKGGSSVFEKTTHA